MHIQLRTSNRRMQQLCEKLEAAKCVQGVEVDQCLHNDLLATMESNSAGPLSQDSFPEIFWKQQQQAAALKIIVE